MTSYWLNDNDFLLHQTLSASLFEVKGHQDRKKQSGDTRLDTKESKANFQKAVDRFGVTICDLNASCSD